MQERASTVSEITATSLPLIPSGISSRAITWENRNGAVGKGGTAESNLGVGRKGSPAVRLNNGQ